MKKLLIAISLLPIVASAQLPPGKYLKVKDDGTGFELFTLNAMMPSDTLNGTVATAYKLKQKTDSLATALAAQTAATYYTIASAAGKATGGSKSLTNNFTTSSITAVSTNLTFAIAANEIYDVTITGTCSKATTATGLKFAIAAPTGATIKGMQLGGGATLAVALIPSLVTAINTLNTTLATGIGIEVCFTLTFRVVNSTTPGAVTLQCATVTSNVATVFSGSKMTFIKSTGL